MELLGWIWPTGLVAEAPCGRSVNSCGCWNCCFSVSGTWGVNTTHLPYHPPLPTAKIGSFSHRVKSMAKEMAGGGGQAEVALIPGVPQLC